MTADVDAGSIQQNSNSASTTLAINKPTGLAVGDLMLAALGCTVGTTYSAEDGWTTVDTGTSQFDGFWKIADADDVAASTFTFTQGNALGNNRGYIIRVTDSDTTTPVEDETIQQQASSSQVGLAVTAAQENSLLVACYIATGTTVVNSVPAGMTSEVNNSTSFTKAVASLVVGSGSTGNKTFTLASSATGAVVMFAINSGATAATGAAALELSASASAAGPAAASAALDLVGTGSAQAPVAATGALALVASGTASGSVAATGAVELAATGAASASPNAAGSLDLTATGAASGSPGASASLELAATGEAAIISTAFLELTATAMAASRIATATADLTLTATGTAGAQSPATAVLDLLATGTARAGGTATGELSLAASLLAQAVTQATAALSLAASGDAYEASPAEPTPAARVVAILAEVRRLLIEADDRTLSIPAENRVLEVSA